jgi:hypothetical protein
MLDHALGWVALRGLHVFACEEFLGEPHTDNWYRAATTERDKIVQMWSQDPTADVAAVPERSGHYVLIAVGEAGAESKARFEEENGLLQPEFKYWNYFGAEHLWFKGSAFTSRIDQAFHIIGPGRYVYLPPSHAPHFTCWEK